MVGEGAREHSSLLTRLTTVHLVRPYLLTSRAAERMSSSAARWRAGRPRAARASGAQCSRLTECRVRSDRRRPRYTANTAAVGSQGREGQCERWWHSTKSLLTIVTFYIIIIIKVVHNHRQLWSPIVSPIKMYLTHFL